VQLRKLEEAGYVTIEKSFLDRKPLTRARVTAAGLKAFRRYLDTMTTLVRSAPKR
jgi:DNA-binding MarR family transcriptional regulator